MIARTRLGMLTPSSNTVVEPITAAMLSDISGVSAHFSRFRVTEIAVSDASDQQFAEDAILRAAELLADAKVDVMAWNGTSASWLGFERDERLCERIRAATGIAACTSVLAFREIFARMGTSRIGLVTPYIGPVQARIITNFASAGIACVAEKHCGLTENFAFAEVSERNIEDMVRSAATAGAEAIAIICTNMRGARLAETLEAELRIPVYDSIATTVWKSLLLAGISPDGVHGWGGLFSDPRLALSKDSRTEGTLAPPVGINREWSPHTRNRTTARELS